MIIYKYLRRDVFYTMLAVTIIVAGILLCNKFIRYLNYVANGTLPLDSLLYLILLQLPVFFTLLLPLGLFVGILLTYSRMYSDSEMTVLFASGMSQWQLLFMTLLYSSFIAVVVGALGIWLNPKFNLERNRLLESASANMAFHTIVPGRFQSSRDGTKVFYTEKLSANKKILKNFFVADQIENASQPEVQEWNIISARQAYNMHDQATGDDFIVASDGYRYKGVIGNLDFQVIKFAEYGMRINKLAKERTRGSEQNLSIVELFKLKAQQKKYMAELQWRLSLPLMALVLAVLAVALSRVNPRQGRFTRFVPAVLIYIIYANMLFVSRDWVESGKVSVWVGMWWTHAAVLLLALYLMIRKK